jgi:anti-anti-sigma factor
MQEGKILAASHHGAYVIRLEGDVRLTLCTTIDEYFEKMFEDPEFVSVWVDLCDAQGIDSTTLGLLAKLALTVKEKFGFQPAIYCCDAGINRLIKSMGFQRLFSLHEEACCAPEDVNSVPLVDGSEELVREKVIEAHRVLMSISPENRARFKDLMSALEHS